jgi:MarR family transcriptional regulator for hemolysin
MGLPNLDRGLGFLVNDVNRLMRREFERRVRGFGLTRPQWILLSHLARDPDVTQGDLAEVLQQEKITVSRQTARLEKNGWLQRYNSTANGRGARQLQLTPKAVEMMARLIEVADQLRLDALSGLPTARREALINDLLQVRTNLQRMVGATGPL